MIFKIMATGIFRAKAHAQVFLPDRWYAVTQETAMFLIREYPKNIHAVNQTTGEVLARPETADQDVDIAPAPAPVVVDNNIAAEVDVVPVMGVTKTEAPAAVVKPNPVDPTVVVKPNPVDPTVSAIDVTAVVTPVEPQVTDDLPLADRLRKVAPQLTDDDIMALEAAPVDTWTVDYIRKVTNVKNKVAKLILDAAIGT